MTYILMALFAAGAVALDQWTKALTVANIALHSRVPFWDGLFRFTYVQNTGAAFSSFEGMQWLFALIFVVFTAAIVFSTKTSTTDCWKDAATSAGLISIPCIAD